MSCRNHSTMFRYQLSPELLLHHIERTLELDSLPEVR